MHRTRPYLAVVLLAAFLLAPGCADRESPSSPASPPQAMLKAEPVDDTAGNCLSFPVIWSEGVTKALRVPPPDVDYQLDGEWWYWWGMSGTDPDIVPLSCPPDPDDPTRCDDGIPLQAGGDLPGDGWVKAYLQKDPLNVWQAGSMDAAGAPVHVDRIDWGDNLESVDWYLRSQVRTEVVLFQDLATPLQEYEMRHVSGWGIDEVHGLAAVGEPPTALEGPGTQGTIYSPCARLTIQKLLVPRENVPVGGLVWQPGEGWVEAEGYERLIDPPLFTGAVHEAGDGPGYYNAEINVKGRIIYGYTWNVRRMNDGDGDYRITFSFDTDCGGTALNTFFTDGVTEIMVPLEEEVAKASDEEEGGATAVLDCADNLTYIDVRIHGRTSGGGNSPHESVGGGRGPGGAR